MSLIFRCAVWAVEQETDLMDHSAAWERAPSEQVGEWAAEALWRVNAFVEFSAELPLGRGMTFWSSSSVRGEN